MQKTRLILALAGVFGLGGLAGCGGGGGGGGGGSAQGPDSFTAAVQAIVASSPDDTEPVAIDSTAVVETDGVEPAPVT